MSPSKLFPGFGHLYSFGSIGSTGEFIADIDFHGADALRVTRGEHEFTGKARGRWAMGSVKPGDVVWTRFVGPVLFSVGVVDALRESRCTGWTTYPVELIGRNGEKLPEYFGLVVHGRCGPIDTSRSVRVMKEYPAGLFPVLRGLAFDDGSWDGSDIFMSSDGSAWTFVTDQMRKAVSTKAKNVRFATLDSIEQVTE